MRWNYTKSLLILAVCAGIVAAVVGVAFGKPERGIGALIWVAVLGMFVTVPMDAVAAMRERQSRRGRGLLHRQEFGPR